MSYIKSISTVVPEHKYGGQELVAFLDSYIKDSVANRKLRYLWNESGIENKYSVLSDFDIDKNPELFVLDDPDPTTSQRQAIFDKYAPDLAARACNSAIEEASLATSDIDAIITVSCTGLCAPGLEIQLSKTLGLADNVERHAVNFMGCYAAFHAMRLANLICSQGHDKNVLIVCIELCSLHFRSDSSDDNLLSTILFGDGASAAIIGSSKLGSRAEIQAFQSDLLENGENDMAWKIGDTGFEMILNKNVPRHIELGMSESLQNILSKTNLTKRDIHEFAIHPGGKNVLKSFANALEIDEARLEPSYQVLRKYGNMSSCSVLCVLKSILDSNQGARNIYAAAFGPGLSIEGSILSVN